MSTGPNRGDGTAGSRRLLGAALFLLSALFVVWFREDRHAAAALAVFALPPLLLLLALRSRYRTAAFWAGVLALGWFSHGVMAAYSRPAEAAFAWAEIALALVIVVSSSWPGLRARFRKR